MDLRFRIMLYCELAEPMKKIGLPGEGEGMGETI
jgi:hypothetical protein